MAAWAVSGGLVGRRDDGDAVGRGQDLLHEQARGNEDKRTSRHRTLARIGAVPSDADRSPGVPCLSTQSAGEPLLCSAADTSTWLQQKGGQGRGNGKCCALRLTGAVQSVPMTKLPHDPTTTPGAISHSPIIVAVEVDEAARRLARLRCSRARQPRPVGVSQRSGSGTANDLDAGGWAYLNDPEGGPGAERNPVTAWWA